MLDNSPHLLRGLYISGKNEKNLKSLIHVSTAEKAWR